MEFFELIGPYGIVGIIIFYISTALFAFLEYLSKRVIHTRVIHTQDELIKSQDRLIGILQKELYKELAKNKAKPHKTC